MRASIVWAKSALHYLATDCSILRDLPEAVHLTMLRESVNVQGFSKVFNEGILDIMAGLSARSQEEAAQ